MKKKEHSDDLTVEIKFDGSTAIDGDEGKVETRTGLHIQKFYVDQRLDSPDFFSLTLSSLENAKVVLLDSLKPGMEIEIITGYDREDSIFKGEVSYVEPQFSPGRLSVELSGYDFSHRLTRGTVSRTFGDGHEQDQNPGKILGDIVSQSKALKGDASDGLSADTHQTESNLEYVAQYNTNDYQFIQQIVGNFGLGWDSKSHDDGKKISLQPLEKGSAVVKICRDKYNPDEDIQAQSADFKMSTVRQVGEVEVRGWDSKAKKPIIGKADSLSAPIGGVEGYKQAGKAHYGSASAGRVLSIVDLPVTSEGEAKEIAQSIMDKLSMDWMTATVTIVGRPDLHAGLVVELVDFGKRYSGEYFIEGCQHMFRAGGLYTTRLNLARNASEEFG